MEEFRAFLHRRRLWLLWLAALAVCVLTLAWVRYDLAETANGQSVYKIVNDEYAQTVAIPADGGLDQQISLAAGQRLYGVRLNMTTYNHAFTTGTLRIDLLAEDGTALTKGSIGIFTIRDNTFETVIFEEAYTPEQA